jgi:DNA modification methylase
VTKDCTENVATEAIARKLVTEGDLVPPNRLYYGDNLEILRKKMRDESVDLCYIDPPFNSKRTYNSIYTNQGEEYRAQYYAFVDMWTWDDRAKDGYHEILTNHEGRFARQTIDLIAGLRNVLGEGSLLAYLVSITLRVTEIHRVLKPYGSFFFHCDPTAGHYLKLVLDGIFCSNGGDFRNEIAWCYTGPGSPGMRQFMRKHDTVFWYSKSSEKWTFNADNVRIPHNPKTKANYKAGLVGSGFVGADHIIHEKGKVPKDWWPMAIAPRGKEYIGYPTQKPVALLDRIIRAASNDGDVILDAYYGCGTSVAVAQGLNRHWIGMDITFMSISIVLKRLIRDFDQTVADAVILDGIPKDMASAVALAHKKDDRLRKEFEKWAILTYTNHRAVINEKKKADQGIDGVAYILTDDNEAVKMLLQVKSGGVSRGDIAKLRGDMEREGAKLGTFITLENPTGPMRKEAKTAGPFINPLTGRTLDKIAIVTAKQMIEDDVRLESPISLDALWKAKESAKGDQMELSFVPARKPVAREELDDQEVTGQKKLKLP